MPTPQGPNVTDPDARALLNAASDATVAIDYMLTATRDGEAPNVEEIVTALADAMNKILDRFPHQDGTALHNAVRDFLGLDPLPPTDDEDVNRDEILDAALQAHASDEADH